MSDTLAQLKTLAESRAFSASPATLSAEQAATAYTLFDALEKFAKARKAQLRVLLLAFAESNGTATEKGGQECNVGSGRVVRERRRSTAPDPEGIKKLLTDAQLPVTEAFEEIKVLELSPSKVKYLIETGKLDGANVEALHAITWALRVFPNKTLKEGLAFLNPKKLES